MAFIPTPNAVRGSLEFSFGNVVVVLTMSWKKGSAVSVADMQDLAEELNDWRVADLNPLLHTSAVCEKIKMVDQTTSSSPTFEFSPTADTAGTRSGTPLPNNVAAVATFLTANRGRSYRGRMYNFGMVQSDELTTTAFTTSYITALASAMSNLLGVGNTPGFAPGVISTQAGNVPRTTGVFTPYNTFRVDSFIDSQRRRLANRGI